MTELGTTTPPDGRKWTKWVPSLVLFLGLVVLVLAWAIFLPHDAHANQSAQCSTPTPTPSPTPSPTASPTPSPVRSNDVKPVPLILEKPEGVVIDFGRDRGVHSRTIFLQAAKKNVSGKSGYAKLTPETLVGISERPLERQELEGHIGPTQYVTVATVTARKEVTLTICVDTSGGDVDPGTYVGSVRLSGADIQPVTVPVSVTLQYDVYRWIVPLLGLVSLLAGSFVVWASHKRSSQKGGEPKSIWGQIHELPQWIADNYVGVVGGVIAMTSVFIARYWRTPAWGARAPEDWFALLGAMFTAYTTTLTAATAIVVPRKNGTTNEPDAGAVPVGDQGEVVPG